MKIKNNEEDDIQTIQILADKMMNIIKDKQAQILILGGQIIRIINCKQDIENNPYINDQLNRYKRIISSVQSIYFNQIRVKERQIFNQFMILNYSYQMESILKRITFRILQFLYISITQLNNKLLFLCSSHNKVKISCQKIFQNNNKNSAINICKIIIEYSSQNLFKGIYHLKQIIKDIENGQEKFVQKLYKSINSRIQDRTKQRQYFTLKQKKQSYIHVNNIKTLKQPIKQLNKQQIKQTSQQIVKQIHKQIPIKQLLKQPNIFEGQVKLKKIQIKSLPIENRLKQKNKYMNSKKIKGLLDKMRDVIDIHRNQTCDQLLNYNYIGVQKSVQNLISRNKLNKKMIIDFSNKNQDFLNKTFNQNISLEKNQNQLHLLQQIKPLKKNIRQKYKQNNLLINERALLTDFLVKINKKNIKKQNNLLNSQKQQTLKSINYVIYDSNVNILKQKNIKFYQKQKLPILNKRAISVDQNYKTNSYLEALHSDITKQQLRIDKSIQSRQITRKNQINEKTKIQLNTHHITINQHCKKINKPIELSKQIFN